MTSPRLALEQKRAELLTRLATREAIEATREADPVDDGLQAAARDVATRLAERARLQLAEVEAALVRLERGEYGICEDCSEPIARARLSAVPWCSRCVRCQEREDRRGRRVA